MEANKRYRSADVAGSVAFAMAPSETCNWRKGKPITYGFKESNKIASSASQMNESNRASEGEIENAE